MAIRNRLLAIVKECRQALEQDARRMLGDEQAAARAAKAWFLELAILRCVEVAEQRPSLLWQETDPDRFRAALMASRQELPSWEGLGVGCQSGQSLNFQPTPCPSQEGNTTLVGCLGEYCATDAFVPSSATFNLLRRHLTETITPDQWREDHLLGWLYQYFEKPPEQKRQGRFYTPEPITAFIVAQTFELLRDRPSPSFRLLDLACGAGAFALQAFDRLYDFWLSQPEQARPASIATQILEQQLFLIDLDPLACELARVNLLLKAQRREPGCRVERMNVFCADALIRWEHEPASPYFELFARRYDAVVGNPPYIVVNRLRTPPERLALYATYRTAAYKPNTFALFLERGLDLLTPDGALGMIIPNTALTQLYFEPLRAYLLERAAMTHIFDTKRLFPKAFVENCILLLRREHDAATRQRQMIECRFETPAATETIVRIPQRRFEHAPFHRFAVSIDAQTFALLEKIAADCLKLGDICECHDGINPGNAKRKLIVRDALNEHCRKVLNGKDIGRYRLNWGGLFARYDRSLAAQGDVIRWGHLPSLNAPKILTRQTADRLIAAFDNGEHYATNSLHTTVLRAGVVDFDLKYLLGLLNSTLLSFYYRKLVFETGQVFSQVKLMNLRQLPIKPATREQQRDVAALVEQLLDAHRSGEQSAARHPADARLDEFVYALYRLSAADARVIEANMGRGAQAVRHLRGV